ncbi:hypothetical protein ABID22_003835 [Pontibacter aydingkolensis]
MLYSKRVLLYSASFLILRNIIFRRYSVLFKDNKYPSLSSSLIQFYYISFNKKVMPI